jgi:hypothetical protein
VCVTGNGYKTPEVMQDRILKPTLVGRSLAEFERVIGSQVDASSVART